MKNFKSILFLLLFVLVCPFITFGCGEVGFDDVPYSSSSLTGEEIVSKVNEARTRIITTFALRTKIETVNIYQFTETSNQDILNKKVKDVITTTIGNDKTNPAVSTVEFTRYVNDKKTPVFREVKTYVKEAISSSEYACFCYTLTENYDGEGNKISTKDRSTYDSGYYSFEKLFDDVMVVSQVGEVDKVYSKSFEGTSYYKLDSVLDGREVASDRFIENISILTNPSLFTTIDPDVDALTDFTYEYGINGSQYLTSAKLSYTLQNVDREKYLTVTSTSKVKKYGDKVSALKEPEDIDDFTAETFMTKMNKNQSYIVYTNSLANDYIKTTVAKLGSTTPDYAVKVETHQEGSATTENYYYYKYDDQLSSKYQCYLLDKNEMTFKKEEKVLDLIGFDFSVQFTSKNLNVYQYGSGLSYIEITMENNEVGKITTTKNEQPVTLFVNSYGEDISSLGLLTLEGRVEEEPAEAV